MREKLFIRFPDDIAEENGLQWVVLTEDGEIESCVQNGTYEQLHELVAHRRVIGFVPGKYTTLTEAELPATSHSKMLSVVPFAVEDTLISDVDDLHFAIGRTTGGAPTPVAVIDKEIISAWHEKLHEYDIHLDELLPDTITIPFTKDGWTIAITNETALIRTDEYAGFGIDNDALDVTLSLAVRNAEVKPEKIRVVNFTGEELNLAEIDGVEISALYDESDYLIQLLALNYNDVHTINLLQGEYSRRSQALKMITPWWPAAAMLAIWIAVAGVNMGVEYVKLDAEYQALLEEMDTTFKKTFPDKRIVPGRSYRLVNKEWTKMKAEMGGTDTNDPVLLELLDKIGATLKNTPGLDLANMSFRAGVLNLELSLNNLQDLENLRTKLETSGGTATEVVSVRAEGSRVLGRLRVQRA